MGFPCIAPEKLPPSSPFRNGGGLKTNMKKIIPVSAIGCGCFLQSFYLRACQLVSEAAKELRYICPGKKPQALLSAAMKKMETGVWSVNGTVTLEKTIKLHGLLSGEDTT